MLAVTTESGSIYYLDMEHQIAHRSRGDEANHLFTDGGEFKWQSLLSFSDEDTFTDDTLDTFITRVVMNGAPAPVLGKRMLFLGNFPAWQVTTEVITIDEVSP